MEKFKHLNTEFPNSETREILTRKGVYPYDYMDDFERFDETELPPQSAFYSLLTDKHIDDED